MVVALLDEVIADANEKNKHVRETVHDVTKGLLYESGPMSPGTQSDSSNYFWPKGGG